MALPGCVVNTRVVAAAGLTVILVEVVLARPLALNKSVIVPATLCDKLANAAIPSTAVTFVAPCKTPLPVPLLRDALTTVLLSEMPLVVLRRLPNWSCTRTTGCCAKTTPAVAVADGCV